MESANAPSTRLLWALKRAYEDYLIAVETGSTKQHKLHTCKPLRKRKADREALHPSDLGFCPLKAALKRLGVDPVNPATRSERASVLHLMRQGVQDAIPMQEALQHTFGALAEYPIRAPFGESGMTLMGTLDALIPARDGEPPVILEIKRRDLPKSSTRFTPKKSDLFQMAAYSWLVRHACPDHNPDHLVPRLVLITMNRYFVELFELVRRDTGTGFTTFELIDIDGAVLLTVASLQVAARIGDLQAAYDAVREQLARGSGLSLTALTPPHLRDGQFLNDENGWQCFQFEDGKAPKAYKTTYRGQTERLSRVLPRCEYWCHGPLDRDLYAAEQPSDTYRLTDGVGLPLAQ